MDAQRTRARKDAAPQRFAACLISLAALIIGDLFATSTPYWQIRSEVADEFTAASNARYISDHFGARLTGSSGLREAREWLSSELKRTGLHNIRLHKWRFGHPGWTNRGTSIVQVTPYSSNIVGVPIAWTPSTTGDDIADVIWAPLPSGVSASGLRAWSEQWAPSVRGRAVLLEPPAQSPLPTTSDVERLEPDSLDIALGLNRSSFVAGYRTRTAPAATGVHPPNSSADINAFLLRLRPRVRIVDAGRQLGRIGAMSNPSFDPGSMVPSVVIRSEDYSRLVRLAQGATTVRLKADIVNAIDPAGSDEYNLLGEVGPPGGGAGVVLVGAHLDSWHVGSGAVDNAVGVTAVLNALQILRRHELDLRKTIRVAFWSGEEQGMLGSKAFVQALEPAERANLAYVNVDGGTGRIRRALVQNGPNLVRSLTPLYQLLSRDLDVFSVRDGTTELGQASDHASFAEVGIPTIGFIHDPMQHASVTWHTDDDRPERIMDDDLRATVEVLTLTIFELARQ